LLKYVLDQLPEKQRILLWDAEDYAIYAGRLHSLSPPQLQESYNLAQQKYRTAGQHALVARGQTGGSGYQHNGYSQDLSDHLTKHL
jgi:hypothetical protein